MRLSFFKIGLLLLFAAALLAGCGRDLHLFQSQPYWIGTDEKPVGFEVGEEGDITVAGTPFRVYVKPGALGGVLKGYEVLYVENNDGEAIPGDPGGRGSLSVRIPRGCVEDAGGACTAYKAAYSESFGGLSLSGPIAVAMVRAWQNGGAVLNWRMKVRWLAEDDNGAAHRWVQEYLIVFPVR